MTVATAAKEFCKLWYPGRASGTTGAALVRTPRSGGARYSAISKREQLLSIVQTIIIANAANQRRADLRHKKQDLYSPESVIDAMAEAVRASELIPGRLSSTEAANEFSSFSILGMREHRVMPRLG